MELDKTQNSQGPDGQPQQEPLDSSRSASLPSLSSNEINNLRHRLQALTTTIENFGETIANVICNPLDNPPDANTFPLDHDSFRTAFEALQIFRENMEKFADDIPRLTPEASPIITGVQDHLEQLQSLSTDWNGPSEANTKLKTLRSNIRRLLSADAERLTPQIRTLLIEIDSTRGGGTNTVDTDIS